MELLLGLAEGPGLAELLTGESHWIQLVRRVAPYNFYYLSAGSATVNPIELLESRRITDLLDDIGRVFEWLVIDSPPLSLFADAACLSKVADATFVVVRSGFTGREVLSEAVSALDEASVTGIILNASDQPRYDKHYYRYGDYGKSRSPFGGPPAK